MISVAKPRITLRDMVSANRALLMNEISGTSRQSIPIFEDKFAEKIGMHFGIATNSGTSAIFATLSALRVGPGTRVAVSSYTNMASIFPIIQLGGEAVPIDIDPQTYNMDPQDLERAFKEGVDFVLVVHIFGHPADMVKILELSNKYGVKVIEDCAEAHGASLNGKKVGTFGIASCFSFYANKLITTGEGGMVLTNDKRLQEDIRSICSLSYGKQDKFLHESMGYNFRMSNLLAAIGVQQIRLLDSNIKKKNAIAKQYKRLLGDEPKLILPSVKENCLSTFWVYAIRVKNFRLIQTKDLIREMRLKGIECREGFVPFTKQNNVIVKYGLQPRCNPQVEELYESVLYLPSGPRIKKSQIAKVAETLRECISKIYVS